MPLDITALNSSDEILHVFDLPQLYSKPSAKDLTQTLSLLSIQPPSCDHDGSNNQGAAPKHRIAPEGITNYLTSIIASPLKWISNDEDKEKIWEGASLRLAERSGRTAMPAMTRSFKIPTENGGLAIEIYEPSLTGDSLGFKTWAASYLLSKRLHTIDIPNLKTEALRILELGSGTGLVGMAAAATFGASVLLTDLPEIEVNLARNVFQNEAVIMNHGGTATTAILDWNNPTEIVSSASGMSTPRSAYGALVETDGNKFPVIVAADSIYSAEHPGMLVHAIKTWLLPSPNARVIIELPRRDGYSAEIEDFKQRMLQLHLTILDEGEETGYDDWGGASDDELQEVKCWWSIWGWPNASAMSNN